MKNKHYVFVYGTLKKGKSNHRLLFEADYLGEYYTNTNFTLFVGGLPYLVKREGPGCSGELYKVSDKVLTALDLLEGHPDFYKREVIPVYDMEVGNMVEAWCYLHPNDFARPLEIKREF